MWWAPQWGYFGQYELADLVVGTRCDAGDVIQHTGWGKLWRHFVRELSYELRGVLEIRSNTERFIVFQMLILQRTCHVTVSQAIIWRIGKHVDAW